MFTGLVEQIATIDKVNRTAAGLELRVRCAYGDLEIGESISVNGVCLTVLESGEKWFTVAAMQASIGRTTIGELKPGARVNLERALKADARFGGHIVQGHVDCVGSVCDVQDEGDMLLIDVSAPPGFSDLLVLHGSVAVNGVSLTVNALTPPNDFQVALIDHTRRNTTLGALKRGDKVNLEGDVIAKYVQRAMEPHLAKFADGFSAEG